MIPIVLSDKTATRLILQPVLLPMPLSRAEQSGENEDFAHLISPITKAKRKVKEPATVQIPA
ncbi:hypothetical protein ACE04B_28720, partial [Rhizobium phaseoli]